MTDFIQGVRSQVRSGGGDTSGNTATTIVALGGNAFAAPDRPLSMPDQFRFAEDLLLNLAPLLTRRQSLVITHGNGPQVGGMLTRVEAAGDQTYRLPLGVCVAETEGELGYVLQRSLYNTLADLQVDRRAASLLTQVIVDESDPGFATPTKAVGPVLSDARAQEYRSQGTAVRDEPGRGPRRVVPSPRPLEIVETDVIRSLLAAGTIVIAAGGGGIPVVRESGRLRGIDAVIDKDLVSALLGEELGATELFIMTDVPAAYRDFGKTTQQAIETMTTSEAVRLIEDGHFGVGTMLPKIEAVCRFCRRPGTRALICAATNLTEALAGRSGTIIHGPPAVSFAP